MFRLSYLLLAMCLVLVPGAALADETDDPPVVTNATVTPSEVEYLGGDVVISASVTDDIGIHDVYAELFGEDGSYHAVTLNPTGAGDTYSGTFTVPPNLSFETTSYQVFIRAHDTALQENDEYSVGDIQVDAQPQFDQAPYVSDTSLTPQTLPSAGGQVTIAATATDDRAVSYVYAVVTDPAGNTTSLDLDPISDTRFQGVYSVPTNTSSSAAQYAVTVIAQDDIGQEGSEDAGVVSVAAAPATNHLSVLPSKVKFGNVRVGRGAVRLFVLTNTAAKGSPTFTATLAIPAQAPFVFTANRSRSARVSLKPRRPVVVLVSFAPKATGLRTSTVTVTPTNGATPVVVSLTGTGIKK